jgi:hypothetical protein
MPALQAQSPEFKTQSHQKKKRSEPNLIDFIFFSLMDFDTSNLSPT